MPSIDERVVSMAFENRVFEQRVSVTMLTLSKLDTAVKNIGGTNGFDKIETQANKVTLQGPMSALDRLKAKLGGASAEAAQGLGGIDQAGNKVTLQGPMSALDRLRAKLGGAGTGAAEGLGQIDQAGNRVTLEGPNRAVDKLQGKLGQLSANSTFADIEGASNRVTLGGLSGALDGITAKFSTLQMAASVALGNIASQAVAKGTAVAKSFTLGPITSGLEEYATNLNSIQTILANTQSQGTNLQDVNHALQELNHYSDQTIYNFSQMAKNIGTFTAAGVTLDKATESIKGIANLAALSGSSAEQASGAMYQLSQAIAAGKVNLQDWISVRTAGMGGEVFQKALFDTAKVMGTIKNVPVGQTFDEWKKAGNSFAQSLSASNKQVESTASVVKKAQKEAAESVSDAQQSAAESVENAAERVKEAQSSYSESVATAAERVKDAQSGASESIENAAERVKEAQVGVAEAAKQSAADVAAATQEQSNTIKQAGEDVKSALDDVREARKRLAEAMKPPSADELEAAGDKLKTAQLDQADLSDAVTDAQRNQTRAAQDLSSAQAKLAALQAKPKATAEELQAAQRAVEDAQKRATDASDAQTRAQLQQSAAARDVNQAEKDLQTTREKGTRKDANVKTAQDALTDATQKYKDAQVKAQTDIAAAVDRVRDAQKKSAEDQMKAGQALADAQKDQAETIVDAQKTVTDAQKNQAKTIADGQKQIADAQADQAKTTVDAQEKVADAHKQAAEKIQAARDSISKQKGPTSWLTSDVLTTTLGQFTGDMTDAQLKAKGFSDEQIKAIQQTAKTAKASATEVKTLKQVFDVAKETIGSGWATTFSTIFGNFTEAKGTFTGLSNTINGFINTNADARNKVLGVWKDLGGRNVLIGGLESAFKDLAAIVKPISDAFREIFPAKTGQDLFDMTKKFKELMDSLRIGPETADKLKHTFKGFFAVLHIGWEIIKGVAGVIGDLLGIVGKGSGGFLNITAGVGDLLVALDETLTKGGLLKTFFEGLSVILQLPLDLLKRLGGAIASLFGGDDKSEGMQNSIDGVVEKLTPLEKFITGAKTAWERLSTAFEKAKTALEPWFTLFTDKLKGFGDIIGNALKTMDFDKAMSFIQTGLVASLFVTLKKAFGDSGVIGSLTGALDSITDVMGGLTGHLETMQKNVQAQTIMLIAGAVLALSAGIYILSTIDAKKLGKAMTAVAVGLGELMGAMKLMVTGMGKLGMAQLPIIAASMIGLAIAVTILAAAMKIFATMSWEDIAKGLVGVAGSITGIGLAMKLMPSGPGLILQAAGLTILSVAMNLMAVAVTTFSRLSWEELAKGLAGVVGSILGIGAAISLIPPTLPLTAAGLLILGIGLNAIAVVVKTFGEMDIFKMVQGLTAMTLAIAGIGLAVSFIPPTIALTAVGLLIVGQAMVVVAGAIALLGNLSIGTLIKGIVGLAAALIVLAGGLTLMIVSLPGSIALLAAAGALAVLAPVLGVLGTMEWSTIFKGLVAIAAIMVTVGIASLIAAPGLLLLSSALIPLGLGFMLVAVAAKIFAGAIALLSDEGQKGFGVLLAAITGFIALLPTIVISFVKGLVGILDSVVALAPKVVEALGKILTTIISFIIDQAPKLALAIGAIIEAVIKVIGDNAPKLQAAGFKLLQDLLNGLSGNIGEITTKVAEIITKFLNALKEKAPELVEAGAATLIAFIQGITNKISQVVSAVANMVTRFINELTKNVPKIVSAGQNLILTLISAIAAFVPKLIAKGTTIIISFLDGIEKAIPKLKTKAVSVARTFLNNLADGLVELANVGFKALIRFLNGLEKAIRDNSKQLADAGAGVADAIIDAMVDAFGSLGGVLRGALEAVFKLLPGWARKILGISSPSKVFLEIGRQTMAGMAAGLTAGGTDANRSMTDVAEGVISTAKGTLSNIPNLLEGLMDVDPVISPILDLSKVEKEAGRLGGLMPMPMITAATSFDQASLISGQKAALEAVTAGQVLPATTFKFEQNNYSPDPLSDIEIYRQTNNQLSRLKSLVGVTA